MACCGEIELYDGHVFADQQGRCFRLHGEADRTIFPNPVNNPYGRWRLEPMP